MMASEMRLPIQLWRKSMSLFRLEEPWIADSEPRSHEI